MNMRYETQEGLLCEYCGHPPGKHSCEEPLERAPKMVPRDNNDEQGKGDSADMKQTNPAQTAQSVLMTTVLLEKNLARLVKSSPTSLTQARLVSMMRWKFRKTLAHTHKKKKPLQSV